MRRVTIGVGPSLFSSEKCGVIGQIFGCNQAFERRQPVFVVAGTIVRFSVISGGLEFFSDRRGPFLPGEVAFLGEPHRKRESLGLPRFGKYGSAFVGRYSR